MPLNCKVELKLKWTKYCVLSVEGTDNDGANPNNIIFTIKETKLFDPVVTLSAKKTTKNYQNVLEKGPKDPCT